MCFQEVLQEVQEKRSALQEMSESINETTFLLFETADAALYQADDREEFVLTFFEEKWHFRVCELIAFKRKINAINLMELLHASSPDLEIIPMPHCDRLLVLTLREILELRELLSGGFAMIELNSLIHRQLIRPMIQLA